MFLPLPLVTSCACAMLTIEFFRISQRDFPGATWTRVTRPRSLGLGHRHGLGATIFSSAVCGHLPSSSMFVAYSAVYSDYLYSVDSNVALQ